MSVKGADKNSAIESLMRGYKNNPAQLVTC